MRVKTIGGLAAVLVLAAGLAGGSRSQSIFSEDFTGAQTTNQWYFKDGACLTAGSSTSLAQPGIIPSCGTVWGSYYSLKQANQTSADVKLVGGSSGTAGGGVTTAPLDPVGSGALRFTNGWLSSMTAQGRWEDGSIIAKDTFNASQGIEVTFKTVTYRGDEGGYGEDGGDGIALLLMDGSLTPGVAPYNGAGTVGGNLGYACSNVSPPYDGLVGAYLGLGIDEYGNFLHGAQLYPGYVGTNVVNPPYLGYSDPQGDNGKIGYGFHPNRIGLRGAGNVSWNYLKLKYPSYYPAAVLSTPALQQAAVQNTCINGTVLDYSSASTNYSSCPVGGTAAASPNCPAVVPAATLASSGLPALMDYEPIQNAYVELPTTGPGAVQIANEDAMARPTGLTTEEDTDGNVFMYDLKVTQNGFLSLSYSVNGGASTAIVTKQKISATNGPLPATLRFGFAAATGGASNIHELLCFKATSTDAIGTGASTSQQLASKVQTGTQAYFAYYSPSDWTGRMTAYGLAVDAITGTLTINSAANWDGQCVLTGVANLPNTLCTTTGLGAPLSAQPPAGGSPGGRVMLTWNGTDTVADPGTAGIPFEWPGGAGLTATDQAILDAGDPTPYTADRLNYLRGVRTNEINSTGVGLFRARDGVLGDIVDSSPAWVGPPGSPYTLAFTDRFVATDPTPENSGQSYASFVAANQGRLNVVYVGANDGFLHAFRSGSEDATGTLIDNAATPNDGAEVLAYMPGTVLNTIHDAANGALDPTNPQYAHNFFVDATPGTGDLFYGGAWHTWLVGGLGQGGKGIYALDITNPSSTNFTEGNAAALVVGDWSAATVSCANVSNCGSNLGNTYGTPQIRRFHNGMWGAIFGNGFGSSSGDAGIFVMTVDQATAATTFYYLSTGTTSTPNGIAYVTAADLDGDHITDYVYAGDLKGNVWRFDLTAAAASGWGVSAPNAPLFKTQTGQPITTPVVLAASQLVSNAPSLIVSFGTGQRKQLTTTSGTTYAAGVQSLYGVWDWNFAAWDSASASQYATLSPAEVTAATGLSAPYTLRIANLQQQTLGAGSIAGTVETSNATVNWATCTTVPTVACTGSAFGWYANLPGSQGTGSTEQIVSSPALFQQGLIVNSTIPASNSPLSCNVMSDTGITYLISVLTGGTFATSPGGTTKVSGFLTNSDVNTVGQTTNESGALSVVNTTQGTSYLIGQMINPAPGAPPGNAVQVKLPTNMQVNRVTWSQLR